MRPHPNQKDEQEEVPEAKAKVQVEDYSDHCSVVARKNQLLDPTVILSNNMVTLVTQVMEITTITMAPKITMDQITIMVPLEDMVKRKENTVH